MAKWVKVLTIKPEYMNFIPETHMVERERINSCKMSSASHIFTVNWTDTHTTHVHTHIHTYTCIHTGREKERDSERKRETEMRE